MKQPFLITKDGINLKLDMTVYAREPVMKALYKYTQQFDVIYERHFSKIFVMCKPKEEIQTGLNQVAHDMLKAIDFEMLRYDMMHQTAAVRQLLIGRALYASCIDEVEEQNEMDNDSTSHESWLEDSANIFKSWESNI